MSDYSGDYEIKTNLATNGGIRGGDTCAPAITRGWIIVLVLFMLIVWIGLIRYERRLRKSYSKPRMEYH